MTLQPLSLDLLELSDEAAGRTLYETWEKFQAEKYRVPLSLAAKGIATATAALDIDRVDKMPVVKALSLAAQGHYDRAGQIVKQLLRQGTPALQQQWGQLGRRMSAQRRQYSRNGNETKKRDAEDRRQRWREIGGPLRAKYPTKSDLWLAKQIASALARTDGGGSGNKVSTIRAALPSIGLSKKNRC